MSITSVGASFGYIDPTSVAGPAPEAANMSETDTAPASPASQAGTNPQSSSPPPPPPPTSSSAPKFSPETGAALVNVQEKASAA
jgi:hypothetical protein